jgi:hypothetical protein
MSVVSINFEGALVRNGEDFVESIGEPIPNAIWALRVFKHNNWEVEIFSERAEVDHLWGWVSCHAKGLVDRINESRPIDDSGQNQKTGPFPVDAFIDSRNESWLDREIDWVEVMVRLYRKGFLERGLLLSDDKDEREKDMIETLMEPLFREIVSDMETDELEAMESREDLIREIESYVKRLDIVNSQHDTLARAKVAGGLLESVLKLLVKNRFDPVGCIILAQQYREKGFDSVSSLFETDIEQNGESN